jgi:hypothetical protein
MRAVAAVAALAVVLASSSFAASNVSVDLKSLTVDQLRAHFCVYEGALYNEGAEICISARRLIRCIAQVQQSSRRLQWTALDATTCDKTGVSRSGR